MDEKKLGLGNVVSISVGLVVATSCLVSLGNGAGTLGSTFIFAMLILNIPCGFVSPIALFSIKALYNWCIEKSSFSVNTL